MLDQTIVPLFLQDRFTHGYLLNIFYATETEDNKNFLRMDSVILTYLL